MSQSDLLGDGPMSSRFRFRRRFNRHETMPEREKEPRRMAPEPYSFLLAPKNVLMDPPDPPTEGWVRWASRPRN